MYDDIPELYFFFYLIVSILALFLSACFFISVPTLTRRRIRSNAIKLKSIPLTWKPKEIKTMIESKTEMNDDRNWKPVAKNRRMISIMKKRSRIKLTIKKKLMMKSPSAVFGSIKSDPSIANSVKMTRQRSIVM